MMNTVFGKTIIGRPHTFAQWVLMASRRLSVAVLTAVLLTLPTAPAMAGDDPEQSAESLRGDLPLDEEAKAPEMKKVPKEREPIPVQFPGQPPLIPHDIRDYKITSNSNKCLFCHDWENAAKFKAPRTSISHYKDSSGAINPELIPSRYFCTQCHVPQVNAKPLVPSDYESNIDGVGKK